MIVTLVDYHAGCVRGLQSPEGLCFAMGVIEGHFLFGERKIFGGESTCGRQILDFL